jgi:hypothetical protein
MLQIHGCSTGDACKLSARKAGNQTNNRAKDGNTTKHAPYSQSKAVLKMAAAKSSFYIEQFFLNPYPMVKLFSLAKPRPFQLHRRRRSS